MLSDAWPWGANSDTEQLKRNTLTTALNSLGFSISRWTPLKDVFVPISAVFLWNNTLVKMSISFQATKELQSSKVFFNPGWLATKRRSWNNVNSMQRLVPHIKHIFLPSVLLLGDKKAVLVISILISLSATLVNCSHFFCLPCLIELLVFAPLYS